MRTVTVNFGGFYESTHDYIVERAVAYTIEKGVDEDGAIDYEVLANVPYETWKEAQNEYSKCWLDYILNNELDTSFEFEGIDSPRFYNYSTDVIIARYSEEDFKKVLEYIERESLNSKVDEHIKRLTTDSSGYVPFYNEDELREDNALYLQSMLDVIIDELHYGGRNYYEDFWC